jgi:hypothetical protein
LVGGISGESVSTSFELVVEEIPLL